MSKKRYLPEFKLELLLAYKKGDYTIKELCEKYQVTKYSFKEWMKRFEQYGIEGLQKPLSWKQYSKEVKEIAVMEYLSGRYSQYEIIRRHEISSRTVLQRWVKHYNSHRELKDTSKGKMRSMTKKRTTSWEERIQIVRYCLENEKNFQMTAETYDVSYQQVYQWVKKYNNGGDEALKDRRGRKKEEQELSPEEKVKLEMKKLERENERLRAENAFFKKVRRTRKEALNQVRFENKYVAIQELHKEKNTPISLLCKIAGITRAAYYKWVNRTPSVRETQNKKIIEEIQILHEKLKGIYGYRRMVLNMNRLFGETFNHKRIYRLMKIAGLQSVIRRKRKRYKNVTSQHVTQNVLNREFTANRPNEKWVTDVTEFKYGSSKKDYLSAILDLYDGSIVSYVLGHSNNNQLVFKTFDQAPIRSSKDELLLHSDRGFQYTSHGFKRRVDKTGIVHSMSRVGRCIDNGPMESFWGTIKCEKYYLHKYDTFEELNQAVDEYIQFYNYDRFQKRLNGLSPMEYRAEAA
ncbi:IS3 family transposase [Bacillus cereus]